MEIKDKRTGRVIYSNDKATTLRALVLDAVENKVSLSYADLSYADLSDTDLRHADLSHANLSRTNLSHADLSYADVSYANLHDADLHNADLRDANLHNANLRNAYLRNTDLSYADLRNAYLLPIKQDFFDVLSAVPNEIAGLRTLLLLGKVNGSCYEGECACLLGSVANLRGVKYSEIEGVQPDLNRPIERFFLSIRKGDTPENSPTARLAVEWIDEFRAGQEISPVI